MLFSLITSKGLQKLVQVVHKDPAEPNLFQPSWKGMGEFTIISGWENNVKNLLRPPSACDRDVTLNQPPLHRIRGGKLEENQCLGTSCVGRRPGRTG